MQFAEGFRLIEKKQDFLFMQTDKNLQLLLYTLKIIRMCGIIKCKYFRKEEYI